MSWGPVVATAAPDLIQDELAKAATKYSKNLAAQDYALDAAAEESIQTAIACAAGLAKTGHYGDNPQVSISGHSNPQHAPVTGFSNDCVTVYVVDTRTVAPASPLTYPHPVSG